MSEGNVVYVQDEVAGHMDGILALFKPGSLITVIVRAPGYPDRDFVMTTDTPDEIAAAVRRAKERAALYLGETP